MRYAIVFAMLVVFLASIVVMNEPISARATQRPVDDWPDAWPKEFDDYKDEALCTYIRTGNLEATVYSVRFHTREEFLRLWPSLLAIKSKGTPIRLGTFHPKKSGVSGDFHASPYVKIRPASEKVQVVVTEAGEVPEYIGLKDGKWEPCPRDEYQDFEVVRRASTDLTLFVDGEIIDLNHTPFPPDTVIQDGRDIAKVFEVDGAG
jgi:hypothetical protein